jgi:hypothetical protein
MPFTFSDRKNEMDSIYNSTEVIICHRVLTRKEIDMIKKCNISNKIYGFYDVDESNIRVINCNKIYKQFYIKSHNLFVF